MDKIVYHNADCDGIVSKCLMQTYLPDGNTLETIGYNYEKDYDRGMLKDAYWVDCSPATDEEFLLGLKQGCVYIDHHDTRKPLFVKYKEEYERQLMYGDSEFRWSGASLVEIYLKDHFDKSALEHHQFLIDLTAIADTWQKNSTYFNQARNFSKFVSMIGIDFKLPDTINKERYLLTLVDSFSSNCEREANKIAESANNECIGNLKVAFINNIDISDASEILRNKEDVDLIVGYVKNKCLYDLSFRSKESYDCSILAKKLGGGGHKCAAGANGVSCWDDNIYKMIKLYIEAGY